MRWANTVIWMDTGANYLIWTDTRGQLFDLDRCEGLTLWFGWTPGAIFFLFGWISWANSLIWMDTQGQLSYLGGYPGSTLWLYVLLLSFNTACPLPKETPGGCLKSPPRYPSSLHATECDTAPSRNGKLSKNKLICSICNVSTVASKLSITVALITMHIIQWNRREHWANAFLSTQYWIQNIITDRCTYKYLTKHRQ